MLLAIIGLVGITNIITRSYLFEKVRDNLPFAWARYLAQCPTCMGTWVGFAYYLVALCPYAGFIECLTSLFIWGGVVSISSAVVVACLDYIYYSKSALMTKMEVDALKLTQIQSESTKNKD